MTVVSNVTRFLIFALISVGGVLFGINLSSSFLGSEEVFALTSANDGNSALTPQGIAYDEASTESSYSIVAHAMENGDNVLRVQSETGQVMMEADVATPNLSELMNRFITSLEVTPVSQDVRVKLVPNKESIPAGTPIELKMKDAWVDTTTNTIYAFATSDMSMLTKLMSEL